MNLEQTGIFLYEHLRRTYQLWLISFAACIASCLSTYVYMSRSEGMSPREVEIVAGTCVSILSVIHALYLIMFLFTFSNNRNLTLAMPQYFLRLPLRTGALVFWRLAYGLVSIGLLSVLSTSVYYALFDSRMESFLPFWFLLLASVTALAYVQTVSWWTGHGGAVVTCGAALSIFILVNWIVFDFEFSPVDPNAYTARFVSMLLLSAFALSYAGVRLHRRGRLGFVSDVGQFMPRIWRENRDTQEAFKSPEEALHWFEYRRQARKLPVMAVICFVTFFIFFWSVARDIQGPLDYPEEIMSAIYGDTAFFTGYFSLVFAAFFAGGLFYFENQRAQLGPHRAFLFLRPVTTKTLAAARFTARFKAVALSAIPLVLTACIALFLDMRTAEQTTFRPFIDNYFGIDGLVIALFALVGVVAAVWVVVWLGNAVAALAVFAMMALAVENLPMFRETHELVRASYESRVTALLVLALWVAAFVQAARRGLLHRKHFLRALALSPIVAAGFFVVLNLNNLHDENPIDYSYALDVVPIFTILLLAPFVSVPLVIQWARHR